MTIGKLIDELLQAEPGSDLDKLIALEIGWKCKTAADGQLLWQPPHAIGGAWPSCPPEFTGSIDWALTLVPDGWIVATMFQFTDFQTGEPMDWGVQLIPKNGKRNDYRWSAHAPDLSVAICIAAMMAREAPPT